MSQTKQQQSYLVPFIIMVVLMSLVGLITSLNGQFQGPMQDAFLLMGGGMKNILTSCITFSVFLAYLVMGAPSAKYIENNGYKKSLITGLIILMGAFGIYELSAYIFETVDMATFAPTIQEAKAQGDSFKYTGPMVIPTAYYVFLLAAFVAGSALTFLQAVLNPYIAACNVNGTTPVTRGSIAGSGNSTMTTIGPLLVAHVIFAGKSGLDIELSSLYLPFLVLIVLVGILIAALTQVSLPAIASAEKKEGEVLEKSVWSFSHLALGVVAIFMYVGVEVAVGNNINLYAKSLDYVSLWFVSGADYIAGTKAQLAFVSTNSVVQGDHVALLFPHIFDQHVEIGYAYHSFKWTNNAKSNAGVTVIVLSLRPEGIKSPKYIFSGGVRTDAKNINGYLLDSSNIILASPSYPMSSAVPPMVYGNKPVDGGNLFIENRKQLDNIILNFPESQKYIRPILGSVEFINGKERWCLWITDDQAEEALKIPAIAERAERVRQKRLESTKKQTLQFAEKPWRFVEARYQKTDKLIVPRVSSERREYIPIGYLGPDTVISDSAFAVYDAEPWLFALLTSRMHMVWTRTVGGRMKTDYRYSNTVVYNNFPVPELSARAKSELTDAALRVLDVREYHSEMTLAQLYDPDTMPQDLRLAHEQLDLLVDSLYRDTPFASDDERLKRLFNLYLKQTGGDAELF